MGHHIMNAPSSRKVSLIGTGFVGSSFAYALMIRGIANELHLVDANEDKAIGEMMDLQHGLSFARPMKISSGGYEGCAGSQVVVITAGTSQKPGETRIDLLGRNAGIFRTIVRKVVEASPESIILIATNPVDLLTYVSLKVSGLPPSQVIGSGTILDTSRFRYLLGQHYGVDARSVHAYILGEHGDSEIPVWSLASIGGVRLQEFAPLKNKAYVQEEMDRLFLQVRDAAYEIIKLKGATYYAIGLGLVSIVEAILGDYKRVLSVSTLMTGQHGVNDICLSLPCIVGASGVEEILTLNLDTVEVSGFQSSAQKLKGLLSSLT